ncbi:mitochondrial carrier domain-containing protein [Leucosporidium creatinivorum]|uniref:Mitochondrial carrier domain-containing protein n=1 Tax=Leucosporidium creatinivorum TaxID=106004 RepID=A0A1Y2ESF1_9BASI|nr:mitochondrial carrier domain-containing protein [Leucosporidium creatinivorum]
MVAESTSNEREPLLAAQNSRKPTPATTTASGPSSSSTPAPTDDEDTELDLDVPTSEERRRSLLKWLLFWSIVAGVVVFCIVEAFKDGGGEFDWKGALKKAGGGGTAGALAMVIQVLTLMPLRTVMNYQYRFGGTMVGSIKTLYAEGGFGRYYAGLGPALFQGPIARFGDTAANAGILALLSSNPFLAKLPSPLKTAFASVAAALFRMILVPLDTLKTTMQTQGENGVQILKDRIKAYGIGTLWYGAWATAAASFVGSFPWFATYNYLSSVLPPPNTQLEKLARQAFIGFVASVVSDTISNSLRVVKTYRQVNRTRISYSAAASRIIATEGLLGLFGRGLGTRILANGLQGLMFSVLWKLIQDAIEGK